jgi:thiol-disulfide isomerase/thioredoxin
MLKHIRATGFARHCAFHLGETMQRFLFAMAAVLCANAYATAPQTAQVSTKIEPKKTAHEYTYPVGATVPGDIVLTLVDGKQVPLAEPGRKTLISFSFNLCKPCHWEVPMLKQYAQQHPEIRNISVSHDNKADAETFLKTTGLGWPMAYGALPLIGKLKINAIPTLMLIDEHGKVLGYNTGGPDSKDEPPLAKQMANLDAWLANPAVDNGEDD